MLAGTRASAASPRESLSGSQTSSWSAKANAAGLSQAAARRSAKKLCVTPIRPGASGTMQRLAPAPAMNRAMSRHVPIGRTVVAPVENPIPMALRRDGRELLLEERLAVKGRE